MSFDITSNIPTPNNLLTLAEQEIDASGAELAGAYRKATRALVKHFPAGQLLFTDFNLRTLRDWIVAMLCSGASLQTVLYYLENVAALYNKAVKTGQAPKTDAFRTLKMELLGTKGETLSRTVKDSLGALSRLAKGRADIVGEMQYYADLLLFSFYSKGLSVAAMLSLTDEDLEGLPKEAMTIADKYRDKRRKRIFPKGAVANVEQRTKMIAHHVGIDTPPDMSVGEITSRLWILAALRLGIPAGTIAQCGLPDTADLAILDFAKTDTDPLSEGAVRKITERVADSITYNPEHWHVMKLRARHTYEEVRDRLKTAKFKHIQYFYPQDEISRKIGKKLEFQERPVLPYVLFFRSKDTDIAPMFKHIGDLAWCYRNTLGGSYAVIGKPEMERFQRTIGHFTPDFEIEPLGTNSIGIGERVRVTGGPMAGYEGIVYAIDEPTSSSAENKTKSAKGKSASKGKSTSKRKSASASSDSKVRLFQLHFFADNGIEWKLAVDERQIERLDTPESAPEAITEPIVESEAIIVSASAESDLQNPPPRQVIDNQFIILIMSIICHSNSTYGYKAA